MNKDELLAKKIIALEIIQTIIQHSDNSYLLRVALTEKLRDLLSCRFVVFIQYNVFSNSEEILSFEFAPDIINRHQLEEDLLKIQEDLKALNSCQFFDSFYYELESFNKYSHTIVVPVTHQGLHIGTILLFDVTKLYDTDTILETFENLVAYISIVLFNTISYHQMENIIHIRTKELKKAIINVNESNKAKSLFLANMSHEMRTPLNGIIGFLNLLKLKETDQVKLDYLKKIDFASNSLLKLISEILDLSRLEFESIELYDSDFDLQKTIEEVITFHKYFAESKGLQFHIQTNGFPISLVRGDNERFKQILNNLISNAIKFTSEGNVDINIETDIQSVKVDNELLEERVKVTCDVVDTGIGIQKQNLQRIFEVFSQEDATTTRKYGGSGLGLAIVKKLVNLMDGEIHVESEAGHGSVFSFFVYFSIEVNDKLELEEDNYKAAKIPYKLDKGTRIIDEEGEKPLNVLVVEDNEINSNLIGEILKLRSIYPDFAANGLEAIEQVKNKTYDIILMDCQMPIMDGYLAATKIRDYYDKGITASSPYIVALTAAVSEVDRKKCFEAGMNDYMSKPIDIETIYSKIDHYRKNYSY